MAQRIERTPPTPTICRTECGRALVETLQNPKVFEEIADLLLPDVYEKAQGQPG